MNALRRNQLKYIIRQIEKTPHTWIILPKILSVASF
jgi:hypothetical protein